MIISKHAIAAMSFFTLCSMTIQAQGNSASSPNDPVITATVEQISTEPRIEFNLSEENNTIDYNFAAHTSLESVSIYTGDLRKLDLSILSSTSVKEISIYTWASNFPDIYSQAPLDQIEIVRISGDGPGNRPDLNFLNQTSNLRELTIREVNIDIIPEGIFEMGKLNYLNLVGNPLTEIPEGMSRLDSLQNLYFGEASPNAPVNTIGSAGLKHLAELTKLSTLNIVNCPNLDLWDVSNAIKTPGLSLVFSDEQAGPKWFRKAYLSKPRLQYKGKVVIKSAGITGIFEGRDVLKYYISKVNL